MRWSLKYTLPHRIDLQLVTHTYCTLCGTPRQGMTCLGVPFAVYLPLRLEFMHGGIRVCLHGRFSECINH